MYKIAKLIAASAFVWLLAGCAQESGEEAAPAESAAPAEAPAEAAAPAESGGNELLAQGDAEAGQRIYILCQSCHSINEGGNNKVGPNLYGVYGAAAAGVEGFTYSEALQGAGIVWDDATLDKWLEKPVTVVPGTTMLFAGVRDKQQRADLIAFMRKNAPAGD
jgi:cytochrome c